MSLKTWPTTRPGSSTSPVRVSVGFSPFGSVRKLVIMKKSAFAFCWLLSTTRCLSHSGACAPATGKKLLRVVTVTRRRRDLRCELVAEIDVHVLLADDVVQAAVATTRNCPVGIGDALAL